MVKFGAFRINEKGGITGGANGDQTGRETSIVNAYTHEYGWRVFRHPSIKTAYWIGKNMIAMCNNSVYGYDQGANRNSAYNAAKAAGWEPANVTTPCATDCSGGVRVAVSCALETPVQDFNTASEPQVLLNLGFKEVPYDVNTLQFGDILCTPRQGHTEIVVEAGAASVTPTPQRTYTVKSGDSLWKIAQTQLGNGNRYTEIMTLNGLTSTVINVGQVLKLPS